MKNKIQTTLFSLFLICCFFLTLQLAFAEEGGQEPYLGCTPPSYDPDDYYMVQYFCWDGSVAQRCECFINFPGSCEVSNQSWPCPPQPS